MKKGQTCCFTGHRDIPENEYGIITANLERTIRELERNNIIYFGAGGALGFDTLAAQSVIKLRAELPRIKLILVLPCLSQAQRWPELDQRVYETIKAQADKVVYTSQEYTRDCMFKRNRHLVEYSGTCVCYLINQSGGTAYTVRYAKSKGLRIINLAEGGKPCLKVGRSTQNVIQERKIMKN